MTAVDIVECAICKKQMKQVTYKHLKHHDITLQEYVEKYPDAKVTSDATQQKKNADKLTSFISKYGEEEGKRRNEIHSQKMRNKNLFETKQQKHGWTREDFEDYNRSRAVTLKNQIEKHGEEEGRRRFDEYRKLQSVNGNKLEYFIEKYGEHEGLQKYKEVCKSKAITLDNLMRKYGETEGKERYESIIVKHKRPVYDKMLKKYGDAVLAREKYLEWISKHTKFSNESQVQRIFTNLLISSLGIIDAEIFSCNTKEYFLLKDESQTSINPLCKGKYWLYDFTITSPYKIIIEFHGDFWHANPQKYKKDDILNFPTGEKYTAEMIWEKDEMKKEAAMRAGFEYKVVWESEFNDDPEKTIEGCNEWILQKLK